MGAIFCMTHSCSLSENKKSAADMFLKKKPARLKAARASPLPVFFRAIHR
jgi:hypothetical protein